MPYAPGKWVRQKNKDNKWFEFILQKKGNSCGTASVLIVKQLVHPGIRARLSEEELRGIIALREAGLTNRGISSIGSTARSLHNWQTVGSDPDPLVATLKGEPAPVLKARLSWADRTTMFADFQKITPKRPAIVGWWWGKKGTYGHGGHWTVCVGPTSDGNLLTILDPWNGIQYLSNSRSGFSTYISLDQQGSVSQGWFKPGDPTDKAIIITH